MIGRLTAGRRTAVRLAALALLALAPATAAAGPTATGETFPDAHGQKALTLVDSAAAALAGADALVLVTEWKEFRNPDFDLIKARLKQAVVFDGRNIYEPALMRLHGIEHHGIGRGAAARGN